MSSLPQLLVLAGLGKVLLQVFRHTEEQQAAAIPFSPHTNRINKPAMDPLWGTMRMLQLGRFQQQCSTIWLWLTKPNGTLVSENMNQHLRNPLRFNFEPHPYELQYEVQPESSN